MPRTKLHQFYWYLMQQISSCYIVLDLSKFEIQIALEKIVKCVNTMFDTKNALHRKYFTMILKTTYVRCYTLIQTPYTYRFRSIDYAGVVPELEHSKYSCENAVSKEKRQTL